MRPSDSPPLLIHLHIPKNAGTTLSRMIKLRLAAWPPTRWPHHSRTLGYYTTKGWRNRVRRIERLPERARHGIRFFEAHCAYGVHERLPGHARYLTMLREPIDRTLSMYWFMLEDGKRDPAMTLEEFVSPAWDWPMFAIDNAQVRYLAGEGGEFPRVPFGGVTRDMLDLAKERIERDFLLAGVTEMFDESILLLSREMGWRSGVYGRSNVTKQRQRVADLDEGMHRRIAEVNELDSELHAFARQRLEARIEALGAGFERELALFRERLAAHNRRWGAWYSALPRLRRMGQRVGLVR